jgi:nitroreductase
MEIEKFIDLVKSRRSIRAYRPDPIPDEYIQQIIEAASGRRQVAILSQEFSQAKI